MYPDADHAVASAPSDRAISSSWCGKLQVDPAGVDVELLAEVLERHGRALDVPAREPSPHGDGHFMSCHSPTFGITLVSSTFVLGGELGGSS
jgi:hypothetical protein